MHLSMKHIDKISPVEKAMIIDIPLFMYNKTCSVKVDKKLYILALADISSSTIPLEIKIATAFYNAARQNIETYFQLNQMKQYFAKQSDFKKIKAHVNKDFSISFKERYNVTWDTIMEEISKDGGITGDQLKALESLRVSLQVDSYARHVSDAAAGIYFLLMLSGIYTRQKDIATASNITRTTIRDKAMRLARLLEKDEKIKVKGNYTSLLKNLATSSIEM